MNLQQEGDGGYTSRPLVIPRTNNSSILTRNFTLDCGGKIATKALEDEMYMSQIPETAEDLGLASYKELPINELPGLGVHWEFSVCYPVGRCASALNFTRHRHRQMPSSAMFRLKRILNRVQVPERVQQRCSGRWRR